MAASQPRCRVRPTIGALILIVAVLGPARLYAQEVPVPVAATPAAATGSAAVDKETRAVQLTVGRSTIVDVGTPIARVSLTTADVADALVTAPDELLINGKTPGTISMFVWDRAGAIRRYEVIVQRDMTKLAQHLRQLFPTEQIEVQSTGKNVVLSGRVSNKDVIERVINVAAGHVENRAEVVSLLQGPEAGASSQVLLRVRFAEVSRNALTELGASYYSDGYRNTLGSVTTQQFPSPFFDQKQAMVGERGVFSDYLNLFLFNFKEGLGGVIKALQSRGLFQSLAEPNLVAESGKDASFLAGGEFPIPVAQASGTNLGITVQFKEFGIRLNFTPTVTGQRIHLKVRPEVSSLDFNNAVVLQGFRIPALSTRRTETELELQNGQTFAIAGLLNNTMTSSFRKIPGIGDIPVLGLLFNSKAAQKDQTELVVMITPEILPNNSIGVTPNLPRLIEPYMPPVPEKKLIEPPPPAFRPGAQNQSAMPPQAAATSVAPATDRPNPAQAAAVMSTMQSSRRIVVQEAPAANGAATPPSGSAASIADARRESAAPNASPSAGPTEPLTAQERKARAREQQREREQEDSARRAQAAEDKHLAREADEERRRQEKEQKKDEERQAQLAREQAERDAQAAKRAAEEAKKQAKLDAEAAERAAGDAKKQAELERRHQKARAEAEARLKTIEAAYQADLLKQMNARSSQ